MSPATILHVNPRWLLWLVLVFWCGVASTSFGVDTVPTYRGAERRLGRGSSERVEFSPDARYLAAPQQGVIRIYDMWDASLVRELGEESHKARRAVYSPADGSLFSIGDDKTLRHWDPATGVELARVELEAAGWDLAINTSGTLLLIGDVASRLQVRDAQTLALVQTITNECHAWGWWGRRIEFSASSRYVYYPNLQERIRVHDLQTSQPVGQAVNVMQRHQPAFLTTESLLLYRDKVYLNASTEAWSPQSELVSPDVYSIDELFSTFLPSRNQVLMTGWHTATDPVSRQRKSLKMVFLYDYPAQEPSVALRLPTGASITQAECSADGRYLWFYTRDGALFTYDFQVGAMVRIQQYADPYQTNWTGWTHDGRRIVTIGRDGWLSVYDAETGATEWQGSFVKTYDDYGYNAQAGEAVISPDDMLIVTNGAGVIWRFNLRTLEQPTQFDMGNQKYWSPQFSPSGDMLAMLNTYPVQQPYGLVTWRTVVRFLDPTTMQTRGMIDADSGTIRFRDEQRLLYVGSTVASEIDVTSFTQIRSVPKQGYYTFPIEVSRDATKLFVVVRGNSLTRYSLDSPALSLDYQLYFYYAQPSEPRHFAAEIWSMATLPDSENLLVGAGVANPQGYADPDGPAEMQMMGPDGRELRRYNVLNGTVAQSIAVSPDGQRAAATTTQGVYIFRINPPLGVAEWSCYE